MHRQQLTRLAACGSLLPLALAAAVHERGQAEAAEPVPVPHGALFARQDVPDKCNADNCARAATGTRLCKLMPTKRAACQSFALCTVTPTPITVIQEATQTLEPATETTQVVVTASVTITVPAGGPVKRATDIATPVTNCPSEVPTFASACSGPVRYSSACACWGYTRNYTTIEPSTVTLTTTISETPEPIIVAQTRTETATATETSQPPPLVPVQNPSGRFNLMVAGGPQNGTYLYGGDTPSQQGWLWRVNPRAGSSYQEFTGSTLKENNFATVMYRPGPTTGEVGIPYSPQNPLWQPVSFQALSRDGGATMYLGVTGSLGHTILQFCPTDVAHIPTAPPWVALDSVVRSGCTAFEIWVVLRP